MDPHKTNLLLSEEFREILLEICHELNPEEIEYIMAKYQEPSNGK